MSISEAKHAYAHKTSKMVQWIEEGEAGMEWPVNRPCRCFGVSRGQRLLVSKKSAPKHQEQVRPPKNHDWRAPTFGYRTVAHRLGMNKSTDQHIFQVDGWQTRKRQASNIKQFRAECANGGISRFDGLCQAQRLRQYLIGKEMGGCNLAA